MATRFYLPASGTSPLASLTYSSTWASASANFFRAPTTTAKTDTALASVESTFPTADTQYQIVGQWVSPPLDGAHSFTSTETLGYALAGYEANAGVDGQTALVVRVVSGDGSVDRGTILSGYYDGEWGLTLSAKSSTGKTLTARNAQSGDRIVIEFGARGVTPSTSYPWYERFGDPDLSTDYSTHGDTDADKAPWVELSPTLAFRSEGTPATDVYGVVASTSGVSGTAAATRVAAGVVAAVSGASCAALSSGGVVTFKGMMGMLYGAKIAASPILAEGTVSGTSGVSCSVAAAHAVAGAVAGVSGMSGVFLVGYAAEGTAAAVSGVACDAAVVLVTENPASGVARAVSGASCAVTAKLPTSGTVAATSAVSCAATSSREDWTNFPYPCTADYIIKAYVWIND